MRKLTIFILSLLMVFTLSACAEFTTPSDDTLTEEELDQLIIDKINEESIDKDSYTEAELQTLIEELLPEERVDTTYDLRSFQDGIVDMLEGVRSGVLGLSVTTSEGSGTGSGVVYKRVGSSYFLVTNDHVVDGATSITVVYEKNGMLFQIEDNNVDLIGTDPVTDLAVVRFVSDQEFSVVPLADSYDLQLGEFVFAIGNPLGFNYYGTVTMGVLSGLARFFQDGEFNATLLQHDAALSPGNSGGALVNMNGELIGVNNIKLTGDNVSGINFAIPSNTVTRVTADLEDDGIVTRPFLGISTSALVNTCELDYGVCVDVASGGTADEAGLENGDIIVGFKTVEMDEFIEIYNFNDLKEAILNSHVGDTVIIRYYRDGDFYESAPTELKVHPDDQ